MTFFSDAYKAVKNAVLDSFYNSARRNPRKADYYQYQFPPYPAVETLEDLYNNSWIIKKACNQKPLDALKNWIEIQSKDDNVKKTLQKEFKRLKIKSRLIEAGQKMNVFGGCAILIGAQDGQTLDQPLNIKRITAITALTILDEDDIYPSSWIEDKTSSNYGLPETWKITGDNQTVHYSRLIFLSTPTLSEDHRKERNGKGDSLINAMQEAFKTFGIITSGVEDIFLDFATKIINIEDMLEKLSDKEGQTKLMERFAMMNATLSNDALLILGQDEKFQKVSHTLSGIKDLIVFAIDCISGACEIPKTKLFGQQLGVLAGAEETTKDYVMSVESFQEYYYYDAIDYLLQCICSANNISYDALEWYFNPIESPTAKELVDMQKTAADTVNVLLQYDIIADDEARAVFSKESDNFMLNIDPNRKIEKQNEVETEPEE